MDRIRDQRVDRTRASWRRGAVTAAADAVRVGAVLAGGVLACGVLVGGVLLAPGAAWAEGPGYGGTADQLTLSATTDAVGAGSDDGTVLAVYGAGFRSGSEVTLRIGDGAETTVTADETGALRAAVDASRTGESVFAVGQTPSGSALTLVGFVPTRSGGAGEDSPLRRWLATGLGMVGGAGLLLRRRGAAGPR